MITKWRTPKLPEPPGPREGIAGEGPPIRLLIIGDSAAAGVGADHQDEALAGQIVKRLAEHFCIDWKLEAVTGATTASTLASLTHLGEGKYDVVVTSLGVNDVTSRISCHDWLRLQRELRVMLNDKCGVSLIVVTCLPPMHEFPALPQPLRSYLGGRATQFNLALESDIGEDATSSFLKLSVPGDPGYMAADGFHPGPVIYKEWGKGAAELIIDHYR